MSNLMTRWCGVLIYDIEGTQMHDLEFDLSRPLSVKCKDTFGLYIYDYLLVFNDKV